MDKDPESNPMNGRGDTNEDESHDLAQSDSRIPLKTPTKESEAKFIAQDSINGEPKIHLDHGKNGFAGMSKEELLKYVNDPFWVRMRTIVFILFWLIWVAMFVASIAIIVMAPKCEPVKPKKWYQEGPLVKVDLARNGNSLVELANQVDLLADVHVKGLILPDITRQDDSGTIDFKNINENYGTLDDLKALLERAREKAIKIVLSLIPNHSSNQHEWFKKSVLREEPFTDYYVWRASATSDKAPNNWLTLNDTSAWTYHPDRKEFYLHQFGINQPDLNFRSEKLKEEFKSIFSFWIDLGVAGFNLDRVQYLVEDHDFNDELHKDSASGNFLNEYGFYSHVRTYNVPDTADILASWRDHIRLVSENGGIVIISGEPPIPSNMNKTVADLVRGQPLASSVKSINPLDLANNMKRVLNNVYSDWPVIEATSPGINAADSGAWNADVLNLFTLLLPGTPITTLGDERALRRNDALLPTGLSDLEENAHYTFYRDLAELRTSSSLLHGNYSINLIDDNAALAVVRWKEGSPGYLGLWNVYPENITLDVSGLAHVPTDLVVLAVGARGGPNKGEHIHSNSVQMRPNSTVLFTFVPIESSEA